MASQRTFRRALGLAAAVILAAVAAPPAEAQSGPEAQYQTGFAYFQKRDYAEACKYFQAAAAQGHVASRSMIQIINGYGYRCAMPSANVAAATLPDIRQLYQGAHAEARAWHGDAALTYAQVSSEAHPGYYGISFLFVSRSARQALSLVGAQFGGEVSPLTARTEAVPLPESFIDLAAAADTARRAGMRGEVDNATLTVWQAPGGPQLPGWLIHASGSATTFLIGAADGRAYPVRQYSYPVQGNDRQIAAMQQAMRQNAPLAKPRQGDPCSGSSMVPMSQRFAWWTPCNAAALRHLYQQSDSNYMMWRRGLRPTPD